MKLLLKLTAVALVYLWLDKPAVAEWMAGIAKVDITPKESVPLAGYGGPTRMSQRVDHPIWLKALALKDSSGKTSVLVTADLVGLSQKMVQRIVDDALSQHGIARERLLLNASHNHSCPITEDVLWLYYELSESEQAARDRYTDLVYTSFRQVIGQAIADLSPAELSFEQGLAGLAVNRRRSRGPESRHLPGPVDHDVPVMKVESEDQLRAIVFGYSCHTTALGGLSINGDYAGFAQCALEDAYPGCTAMFVQNCGGDANPLPRIRGRDDAAIQLAAMYGQMLAEAVVQVVDGKMQTVPGPLKIAMDQTELLLEPGPSLEELYANLSKSSGMVRREIQYWIDQYRQFDTLPDRVPYPIQVWSFGPPLTLIALTGETVVDYSLTFKELYGWNQTWVCGYNNDLLSYVPSRRVLIEGGYEGTTGMAEYGHRAAYTADVEQRIVELVGKLVRLTETQLE